ENARKKIFDQGLCTKTKCDTQNTSGSNQRSNVDSDLVQDCEYCPGPHHNRGGGTSHISERLNARNASILPRLIDGLKLLFLLRFLFFIILAWYPYFTNGILLCSLLFYRSFGRLIT